MRNEKSKFDMSHGQDRQTADMNTCVANEHFHPPAQMRLFLFGQVIVFFVELSRVMTESMARCENCSRPQDISCYTSANYVDCLP